MGIPGKLYKGALMFNGLNQIKSFIFYQWRNKGEIEMFQVERMFDLDPRILEMPVGEDRKLTIQKWNWGWRSLFQFETVRNIVNRDDFDYALTEPFPPTAGPPGSICAGYFYFVWMDKSGRRHKTMIEGNGTISKDSVNEEIVDV